LEIVIDCARRLLALQKQQNNALSPAAKSSAERQLQAA
jgi:hypothetical protein